MEAGVTLLRRPMRYCAYVMASLIILTVLSFPTFAQRKNLTFSCDFEGSTLLNVWPTVVGHTTQSSTYSREGSYSARIEVIKGDPMIASGARSEMNLNPIASVPAEQWFGMSYYIPTTWTADANNLTDILAQWHSASGTPPIAFGINVNSWYVQFKSTGILSLGTVNKGTWTDVVFHIKWSTGSAGLTEIWINGTKVETFNGANFPAENDGPFFKCGCYKWPWNTGSGELDGVGSITSDRLLYMDAVRVGNASATYADVAPGTSTTTSTPVISLNATQTITLPTSSVSLTGTVTDLLSVISSTVWTQVSGPNTATIKSASSLTTTASNLVAGTYVFKLTATDLLLAVASATITVNVNPAPAPPTVSAGTDKTITLPTSTITLKGTATDPAGTITDYAWTQTSGPNTAKISSPTSATSAISGLVAGTYVFSLEATDSYDLSASASVTVIVNPAANQSPVANAGASQVITLPNNSVTLDGSSSDDPDGSIVGYAWTKISGPNQGTLSNTSKVTASVSNLVAGTYVYQLLVTDNSGATNTDQVTITVNAAENQTPVANAGSGKTITLPTNTITLDGSKSADPDGTIAGYSWSQVSGPSTATLNNATTSAPTATSLVAGQYIFQLTVTDNSGATATAQVKIIVNAAAAPVNQAPVADAGSNQTITLPAASVTLDGSGSSDPDGTISSYKWLQITGAGQSTITGSTKVNPTITALAQGVYTFQLTVTDNSGATDVDTVKITVNAAANQPPVADAGSSKNITLPTSTVSLSGSKSADPDGTISGYSWSQVSGPSTATITGEATVTPTVSGLVAGQYFFQLTVTDNSGATATAQVKIIVNPAAAPVNQSPVAEAGDNQTITLPTNAANLDGTASADPDGTVDNYKWTQLSGPDQATITASGSATTAVSNLSQGTYTFQLTVTDNDGATDADVVSVIVKAAANISPIADAGSSKTITLPLNTITLNGSGSTDPNGTIVSYSWTQVSGPSPSTITGATTATPTMNNLQAGTYYFGLTVTDNDGLTDNAQVRITVRAAANQLPVANAGASLSITLPLNTVTLDGSGSQDPDGTIVSYSWTKTSGPATGGINNASSATTSVNNLVQGVYTFQLTVTDNSGAKNTDVVTVTVNAKANISPIADAGANKTITLPVNTVTLDASNSADPDGTVVSYKWSQVSGPATSGISNTTSVSTAITGLQAGTYYFQVTVTDNSGATDNALVKVTVRAANNIAPIANAGASQVITLPVNTATLDGSGSADQDGTISAYVWTKIAGPTQGTISNGSSAIATATNLVQGTYTFSLQVTDNSGAIDADNITVTVNAAKNRAPVANAGASKTITLPANTITFDGSASSDPDGTIASYSWAQVSGPGTPSITGKNTAKPTVTGLLAGQYMFQLTVTDNGGATATAQVKVVVNAAVNQPPVADAGNGQTITLPTNSVVLDGSNSSDADGSIATYSWTKLSGSGAITLVNSNTAKPSVVGLQAGTYVFQLTVTDNAGASATDNVTIVVNAAGTNQAPVANAGVDQSITLPTTSVTLDGSKSADPGGAIASYNWTKVSGTGGTITNANTAKPSVSGLQSGSYVFKLTVTDNTGATGSDQMTVTVNEAAAAIQAPVADAGNDTTIAIPATSVELDGSGSKAPGGSISSYNWEQVSGPQTAAMSSWNTAKTMASNLIIGEYEFRLTVKNNRGVTSAASVKITVLENLRTSATSSILLYPNPAQSVINLRLISDSTGNMKVNIFDMTGKLVMVKEMSKPQSFFDQSLNIGSLAHGMYTLQVIIGTNKGIVSKFIKQ